MAVYQRITDEEMKRLRRSYYGDQLYNVLCPVMKHYGEGRHELSPVELWTEARRMAGELALSPRPDLEITDMADELAECYRTLSDMPACERTRDEADRTAFLVEMLLLFMLHAPLIGKMGAERDGMIKNLTRVVMVHPLCEDFMGRAWAAEDMEEKQKRYVEAFNYLMEEVTTDEDGCKVLIHDTVKGFIENAMKYNDEEVMKGIIAILTSFNTQKDHLFDDILNELFVWMKEKNKEGRSTNYKFYAPVGNAGGVVERQMLAEPAAQQKGIQNGGS
jgi:hypothetical protein